MKSKHIVIVVLAAVALAGIYSFKIVSQAWNINPQEAKITFTMPEGKHSGSLGNLTSTFEFDPLDPTTAVIKASVDVNSITTDGGQKLDDHLKSPDFFDAANHPLITFTGESVTKTDSGFVATGKLAMRDSIHTISIPFTFVADSNKAVFKGKMDIFAGDYGVGKKSPGGNDRVVIDIEVPVAHE